MRLFPAGEALTCKGLEQVPIVGIFDGPDSTVVYEYRPIEWTQQVRPIALGAQVAGVALPLVWKFFYSIFEAHCARIEADCARIEDRFDRFQGRLRFRFITA